MGYYQILQFHEIFQYKQSILGYPHSHGNPQMELVGNRRMVFFEVLLGLAFLILFASGDVSDGGF